MKRTLQSGGFFLCVLVSAAGMYNVFSDNAEVEKLAQQTACGPKGETCGARKTMMSRSPFAQTFDFAVGKGTKSVRCARQLVFVGEYACALR